MSFLENNNNKNYKDERMLGWYEFWACFTQISIFKIILHGGTQSSTNQSTPSAIEYRIKNAKLISKLFHRVV